MENIKCSDCEEYKNEWCEKVIDSPVPDMTRDCQYFHEKDKDLVRVVRCHDCIHHAVIKLFDEAYDICVVREYDMTFTEPDGFCYRGEG